MKKRNHIIVGSAFSLAALAVAIDHTRHPLPKPKANTEHKNQAGGSQPSPINPCSVNPCSVNPCSVNPCSVNPCSVNPCSINPCSLKQK